MKPCGEVIQMAFHSSVFAFVIPQETQLAKPRHPETEKSLTRWIKASIFVSSLCMLALIQVIMIDILKLKRHSNECFIH